ncbi:MAG TPA: SDR family oxidoreductase [Rhodothermales bacterium]|nr:SDR family oxidoreductase [Rhodothermales bacterium]
MPTDQIKTPPPQKQEQQPGRETEMHPEPIVIRDDYKGSGKLQDKIALITGGDSGIGRSVAVHFAREGADVAIVYLNEHEDAKKTKEMVEQEGRRCIAIPGDIGDKSFCERAVERTLEMFSKLDVLVNNAAVQYEAKDIREITEDQLERTFRTNIFGQFFMTQAALDHLEAGSSIINTTSVTAYRGQAVLLDYASTKGAILAFTRSLASNLADKKIRVNGVAPGATWTPLIPASFSKEQVDKFGGDAPLGRVGQPADVAPSYVFLASQDAAYMTGQVLHPNGGEPTET